jgi:hypothetical protein
MVIANGFRIGVREQWKINPLPLREVFQDRLGIVADRSKFDPLFLESRFRILQLDQLPFAVGSPISRTEEEKNCALGSLKAV